MANERPERRLVLWDVDHTLIDTRGVGTILFRAAFEAVTGQAVEHDVPITGRTELAIVAESLELHGIDATDDLIERYRLELVKQYVDHVDDLRGRGCALPGAATALATVAQAPGFVQTVLTGNLRDVAVIKLRTFGLDDFLDLAVGAFGEDYPERARLVALAQQRASTKHGVEFSRSNTIIVGDTTSDVAAGREGGARVVAVATGKTTEQELRDAGADTVIPDLLDVGRVLDVLG